MTARKAVAAVVNDLRDAVTSDEKQVLKRAAADSADRLGLLLERGIMDAENGTVSVSVTFEEEGKEWVFSATGTTPEESEELLHDAMKEHGFEFKI